MNLNTGSTLFLVILVGCVLLLVLSLVLVGLRSKKKKPSFFAKAIVVLLALITTASFVTYPLIYNNVIDINLRLGYFKMIAMEKC